MVGRGACRAGSCPVGRALRCALHGWTHDGSQRSASPTGPGKPPCGSWSQRASDLLRSSLSPNTSPVRGEMSIEMAPRFRRAPSGRDVLADHSAPLGLEPGAWHVYKHCAPLGLDPGQRSLPMNRSLVAAEARRLTLLVQNNVRASSRRLLQFMVTTRVNNLRYSPSSNLEAAPGGTGYSILHGCDLILHGKTARLRQRWAFSLGFHHFRRPNRLARRLRRKDPPPHGGTEVTGTDIEH
jgi:hypothetical protein